jgi:release factor glutamine methyltransferase
LPRRTRARSSGPPSRSPFRLQQVSTSVHEALHWGAQRVEAVSSTPLLDAELLLGHVNGMARARLLAHLHDPLDWETCREYLALVEERSRGVPVAYLRGWTEWYGLRLEVTPEVLIPRPETELVVEEALHLLRVREGRRVVDVGTGSGNIAIALATHDPDIEVYAIDRSVAALAVAQRNVASHGLADRISTVHGDVLEHLPVPPDLVVANLPYIPSGDLPELALPVRFEPAEALDGGPSGLFLYENLVRQLAEHSWNPSLVCEIDPRQTEPMLRLFADPSNPGNVNVRKDLASSDRVISFIPHAVMA